MMNQRTLRRQAFNRVTFFMTRVEGTDKFEREKLNSVVDGKWRLLSIRRLTGLQLTLHYHPYHSPPGLAFNLASQLWLS